MTPTVSQEQRDREAAVLGLKWTEPCGNAHALKGIRCLTCRYEWTTKPNRVQQGYGCPKCAGNLPATQEQRDREADAVNLEWTEPYTTTNTPTGIRCRTCGREWKARPNDVQQGNGCAQCAGMLPPPQEQRDREAAVVDCDWIEPYRSAHAAIRIRCRKCRHEWKATPANVRKGTGCPRCSPTAVPTQEQRDREAAAMDLEWTEPYKLSNAPTGIRCRLCDYEWKARPNDVQQGIGCPVCRVGGFDPAAPSLVYLLSDSRGAAKVGIANRERRRKRSSRIGDHEAKGWNPVESWDTETGSQARQVEQEILRWWRKDLGLPPAYKGRDGDTETVDSRKVSLEEIKARIEQLIVAL